jgi:hypothetical protein
MRGKNFDRIDKIKMIFKRQSANPVNHINPVQKESVSDGHRPPLQEMLAFTGGKGILNAPRHPALAVCRGSKTPVPPAQ